jgi:TolA-binding protein
MNRFMFAMIMMFACSSFQFCHGEGTGDKSTSGTTTNQAEVKSLKLKPILKPSLIVARLDPVYKSKKTSSTLEMEDPEPGNSDLSAPDLDAGSKPAPEPEIKPSIDDAGNGALPGLLPATTDTPPDVQEGLDTRLTSGTLEAPGILPSDHDAWEDMDMQITRELDDLDESPADIKTSVVSGEDLLDQYMDLEDREARKEKLSAFITEHDDPQQVNRARLQLGRVLADMEQTEKAAGEFNRILDDPGASSTRKAGAMAGKADLFARRLKFQDALATWKSIEEQYPEYLSQADHLLEYGLTVLAAGDLDAARVILNEADRLDNERPEAAASMLGRALASELQGDPKTSKLILNNLVKRFPDSQEAEQARVRVKDLNNPLLPARR